MAALLTIDPRDPTPLYAQLERAIRAAMATGRLRSGEQLPTVRQLAVELRVNANTVARVYSELERAGLLETRRGVGTFATGKAPDAGTGRGRKALLRAFADRVLADAASQGFSARELIEHLQAVHTKGA